MSVPTYNLTAPAGFTFQRGFLCKDALDQAIDWTGYTFTLSFRDRRGDAAAAHSWTSTDGDIVISEETDGLLIVTIPADETPEGSFYFDLTGVNGAVVVPVCNGIINFTNDA